MRRIGRSIHERQSRKAGGCLLSAESDRWERRVGKDGVAASSTRRRKERHAGILSERRSRSMVRLLTPNRSARADVEVQRRLTDSPRGTLTKAAIVGALV